MISVNDSGLEAEEDAPIEEHGPGDLEIINP